MAAGKNASIVLLALVGLACGACGDGSSSSDAAPPTGPTTPWTEIVAEDDCAAGMRPSVGLSTCVPVGVPSCPDGFAPDPSGWGCRDVQPDARCEGATREVLGKTTCMPIGDCDASFPPKEATLFVDAKAQPDATHFTTISAAVAAATSGAVIAVERGSYVESVAVRIPVTIQGRCARDVLVTSPDGKAAGVEAGAPNVTVRGLTLRGHRGGVVTVLHGSATVEDVLVDHARLAGFVVSTGDMTVARSRIVDTQVGLDGPGGVGVLVQHGTISVTDSSVVGGLEAGIAAGVQGNKDDSKVHLERSIVRDVQPSAAGNGGAGLSIGYNGSAEIVESAIVNVHASGIEILDGAKGSVARTVVRGVLPNGRGDHGDALAAGGGAVVAAAGVSLGDASQFGVLSLDAQTSVAVTDSVVTSKGRGITASSGGQITLASVAVVGTTELGLLSQEPDSLLHAERCLVRDVVPPTDRPELGQGAGATFGGALELVDTAIVRAAQVGVAVGGQRSPSRASLDHVVVLAPRISTAGRARGIEASAGSDVTVTDSIVSGAPEAGIVAGDEAWVKIARSVVRKTAGATYQHGIVAVDRATIDLTSSLVEGSGGAGIAFSSARGRLDAVLVRGNTLGLAVIGSAVREVDALPDDPEDGAVLLHAAAFQDNVTRFSGDELPLPTVRGF